MKKFTSIVAFLSITLFSEKLAAQLPYTSSSAVPWHASRDYEVFQNMDLNGQAVPIVTMGSDVLWDLRDISLPDPYIQTVFFEPAIGTPFYSSYPNSNMVAWETDPFGNSDYNYFNNSPFELRLLGAVHVENGTPENISFCPDPFLVMDYPMSIGSGVQHIYSCPEGQGEVDNWVIMATGTVLYDGGSIQDLVQWRSIYTGPGYADTSYFWTQMDNVLYPVVRYLPGAYLRVRNPVSETVLGMIGSDEEADLLSLHPNPAADQVVITSEHFNGEKIQWIMRDALGRVVKEASAQGVFERITIDISDLIAGSYSIQLRTAEAIPSRASFIKQ
ncbi:MAG: T9SS type A sorting domain-containing protein [Bacteroidota bacterium]|nr:T9SS type A sorting domain-containing protein [Bacteroidota bacterium]